MTQFPPGSNNPPAIPPQAPFGGDFGLEPQRKAWPKVIGIISIVWGSLALICNGCGLVGQMFQSAAMGMMPQQTGGQQIPPMPDVMKPGIAEYAVSGLGILIGVILITGGSMLVARNPIGRVLHLAYAGLSIVITLAGTALAIQKQSAIAAWAKQNTEDFWAKQQGQSASFAMIGIGVVALLGLAYPIFCLVWFGAVKRDTREITEGREETPV
jgi:hypothetical protein